MGETEKGVITMQLRLLHSLKSAIEGHFETTTVLAHSGAKYPETNPYFVIKQVSTIPVFISKNRETANVKYYVQVSFYADSYTELVEYQDKIRDYFMFGDLPLSDDNGIFTGDVISFTVMNEVPLYSNELPDESSYHQVHFDLMAEKTKHKSRGTK